MSAPLSHSFSNDFRPLRKSLLSNLFHALRDLHLPEIRSVKRVPPDTGDSLRDLYSPEILAEEKSEFLDLRQAFRQLDLLQGFAAFKGPLPDEGDAVRDIYF